MDLPVDWKSLKDLNRLEKSWKCFRIFEKALKKMKVLLFSLVVTERGIKDLCFLFLDEYLSINLPTELQVIATINRAKTNLTVFISGLSVQKCEFKPIPPCFIDRCQVHFLFYTCCKDHVVTRHIMLGYRQHTPLNDLRNVLLLTTWLKSNGFSSWVTILILQPEGRNFFAMPEGCKIIIVSNYISGILRL